MKTLLVIALLAVAGFGQVVKYDKFKDETTVHVEVKVKSNTKPRNKLDNLKLLAAFKYSGQTLRKNIDLFGVAFSAGNQRWRFLRSHGLIMMIDGERHDLGSGDHDGQITGSGVYETVTFIVDRSTFSVIANAKTLELQLGPYEGFIDEDNLAKLKAYFALTTPQLSGK